MLIFAAVHAENCSTPTGVTGASLSFPAQKDQPSRPTRAVPALVTIVG
jgi:hypothetical protein